MRPRVYVPNDNGHDTSDAERFGEVVFLTSDPVRRTDVQEHCRQMRRGLRRSAPEDYLAVGGLSILTAVAASVFAQMHGRVNFLLWDHGSYVLKSVSVLPTDSPRIAHT